MEEEEEEEVEEERTVLFFPQAILVIFEMEKYFFALTNHQKHVNATF